MFNSALFAGYAQTCSRVGFEMKWNRKSVLVTGGAGFIGSRIAAKLNGMGANVIVVDDLSTGDRNRAKAVCNVFVEGDVSQAGSALFHKTFHKTRIFGHF
jgi:UDP-glucose 4-epimerase